MKRKFILVIFAVLLTTAFLTAANHNRGFSSSSAAAQSAQRTDGEERRTHPRREDKFDRIADMIIVGLISEEQFLELGLGDDDSLEVFRRIREKRSWHMDDESLARAINHNSREAASARTATAVNDFCQNGRCCQRVEVKNGRLFISPPPTITFTNPGECGTDNNDVILSFRTPKWPNTDPYKIRIGSDLWWIRWQLNTLTFGGPAANGLCSDTTRVCAGYRVLSTDVYLLYLWHDK